MVHKANRPIFASAVLCMLALPAASDSEPGGSNHGYYPGDIGTVVSRLKCIRELLALRVRRTSMDELTLACAHELAQDIG